MSMTIKLYHNDSDKRTVNKTLTNEGSLTGATIIDDTTILNPRLKVRDNGIIMVQYNYCYIADFKRYYYITNITVSNGYIIIDCKVDVLMSYANEIKACSGIIKRQENKCNYYLDDEKYKSYEYSRIQTKLFPNGFTTNSFVLTIAGGGN
jgi:hypothetical protein